MRILLTIVVDSERYLYGCGVLLEGKHDYVEWNI